MHEHLRWMKLRGLDIQKDIKQINMEYLEKHPDSTSEELICNLTNYILDEEIKKLYLICRSLFFCYDLIIIDEKYFDDIDFLYSKKYDLEESLFDMMNLHNSTGVLHNTNEVMQIFKSLRDEYEENKIK